MGEHKSYRVGSRTDWGTREPGGLTLNQINTGAILRIADACEVMAGRHQELIDSRDWYKGVADRQRARAEAAERRVAALRGVITRMKRNAALSGGKAEL